MSILPVLAARSVIRKLTRAGFVFKEAHGSHYIFAHPANGRMTAVPMHGGKDIDRKLMSKIIKQTGLSVDEFLKL